MSLISVFVHDKRAMLTEKIVGALVLAAVLTAWTLAFQPMYASWVVSQGGTMGIGETFGGYLIPIFADLVITWLILRRLRNTAD